MKDICPLKPYSGVKMLNLTDLFNLVLFTQKELNYLQEIIDADTDEEAVNEAGDQIVQIAILAF